MISETTLATSYTSFWKGLTPNSERFIRRLNLNLERYSRPIKSEASPERRAFINEAGFRLFARTYGKKIPRESNLTALKTEIFDGVRTYLRRFSGVAEEDLTAPTEEELLEVEIICDSIGTFVRRRTLRGEAINVAPRFKGCGILDASEGDLLIADTLFEIKAGDRSFRATDIRQLLIYCALNSINHMYQINRIGCLNPRTGTYFEVDLDTLGIEMSSKSSVELLSDILYFVSSGDTSR